MRYLILLFILVVWKALSAQQLVAVSGFDVVEIQEEAKIGHFQWVFPEGTTAENLEKLAKYYTAFFTYTYNGEKRIVDVFPVVDSEETRRIMLRFLGANQVGKIAVGKEELELYAYYEKFMKFNAE